MKKIIFLLLTVALLLNGAVFPVNAAEKMPQYQDSERQMERLNRGLIAVKTSAAPSNGVAAGVYLSWRLLGDESLTNQAFDIYRNNTKIYTTGNHEATNYIDTSGTVNDVYKVVKKGESPLNEEGTAVWKEHAKYASGSLVSKGTSKPNAFSYIDVPIVRPENTTNHGGGTSRYYTVEKTEAGANDASVGDLDGDGDYEIVLKWDPSDSKDSASGGYTGNVYIDAYEISENNGGYMWRIDMGKNIRAGAHYTQFMVYDFDGDGKSEIAMKTAPGTIDGTGRYVTEVGDTEEIRNADNTAVHLSGKGIPTSGGEYVTIFDGETGKALYTTEGITRNAVSSWGDSEWNRSERYLAAVAYIDGETPHFIECRGYYAAAVIRAYKWDGYRLELVWEYKGTSGSSSSMYGQGNHNLSVGDIDNDGKDEIVYGSACLDDDGKTVMGNTRYGHGDAMHMSDFNNDGVQEVFSVQEDKPAYAENLRVASTGEILYCIAAGSGTDNGRGVMANVDDEYARNNPDALSLGWSIAFGEVHDLKGNVLNARPKTNSRSMTNFLVYWDGDLGREILDDNQLAKYDAANGWTIRFYHDDKGYIPGTSNNYSKQTPSLVADLWGDWREEIIMPIGKGEVEGVPETPYLRIMTSVMPTSYRLTTLMHDCQYRLGIAWQNVAYNQPSHTSYYIGSAALAQNSSGVYQNYLAPAVKYTRVYYPEIIAAEGVELTKEEIEIKAGASLRVDAVVYPENATVKGVEWTSDDESVAVVSNGVITGVGKGETVVTATTRDGGFSASCVVRVLPVKEIDALDKKVFTSDNGAFSGGTDYGYLPLSGSSTGASFYREFTPFYENKATVSFRFNTGGQKLDGSSWNWDGHEYTFGIEFLDVYGNNILNVAQSYKSSAQSTTAKVIDGNFDDVKTGWTVSGEGEEPMSRSSTTWYVTLEFDYDNDICTATIAGSDKLKSYTKVFSLNGRSFKTFKYWLTKDGSGDISVSPSLSELSYKVETIEADGAVSIVGVDGKDVLYTIYGESDGYVIGALYNSDGSLDCAVSKKVSVAENPKYDTVSFTKNVSGYKLKLYYWSGVKEMESLGLEDETDGTVYKLEAEEIVASAEPEAANSKENLCDGRLDTYWTSEGVHSVTLEFDGVYDITGINLAFRGYDDNRYIPFTVSVSENGEDWNVVYKGNSVPHKGDFMNFYVPQGVKGQFMKVVAEGNSISGWNSIAEIEVYGTK